jgi:hypothetical protein
VLEAQAGLARAAGQASGLLDEAVAQALDLAGASSPSNASAWVQAIRSWAISTSSSQTWFLAMSGNGR